MSERELKLLVEEKTEEIAKVLYKGRDFEIRNSQSGIVIVELRKHVVSK